MSAFLAEAILNLVNPYYTVLLYCMIYIMQFALKIPYFCVKLFCMIRKLTALLEYLNPCKIFHAKIFIIFTHEIYFTTTIKQITVCTIIIP